MLLFWTLATAYIYSYCFRCAHALLVHNCLRQATVMIKTKPLLRLRPDMAARIPNQKQVAIDMWECVSKFLLL